MVLVGNKVTTKACWLSKNLTYFKYDLLLGKLKLLRNEKMSDLSKEHDKFFLKKFSHS